MTSIDSYTDVQQRRIAAVVGTVCADAAVQPLQWIYNDDVLAKLIDGVEEIEFRTPSANPFFRVPTGHSSMYGDGAMTVLRSLVASQGLSIPHLTEEFYKTFGPDSEYGDLALDDNRVYPIPRPWRNTGIRDFMKNYTEHKKETGCPTDDQIDCAVQIVPLVALYAGHPELLDKVTAVVRVTQANDVAVAYACVFARVLEQFILRGDPANVLQTVMNAISSPHNPSPQPLDQAVVQELARLHSLLDTPHSNVMPAHYPKN